MDNLTHTLIGATTAKALPARWRKNSTFWALVIGNNLPDCDFIYSLLPGISGLDYLVHHRGYTHSFFSIFALALPGAWLASKLGRTGFDRQIYLFTLLGCFMHIGADYLNNYGVHPFSPLLNQWSYGDTLFIAEPLIWAVLLPSMIFVAARKSEKVFWAMLMLAVLSFIAWTDYLDLPFKIAIACLALGSLMLHRKARHARYAFASLIFFICLFRVGSMIAKNQVRANLQNGKPLDLSATPNPANPFCWTSWMLTQDAEAYRSTKLAYSISPTLYPNEACLNVTASRATSDESLMQKASFKKIYAESCKLQRLMSFVRFPYLKQNEDGLWTAGDLRYAYPGRGNFTEVELDDLKPGAPCPAHNRPWDSPFFDSVGRLGN